MSRSCSTRRNPNPNPVDPPADPNVLFAQIGFTHVTASGLSSHINGTTCLHTTATLLCSRILSCPLMLVGNRAERKANRAPVLPKIQYISRLYLNATLAQTPLQELIDYCTALLSTLHFFSCCNIRKSWIVRSPQVCRSFLPTNALSTKSYLRRPPRLALPLLAVC
jgi:hypothetical protein